ncbi:MAG TPA: ABC transporter permease subunit [Verrucomicrobiae bacterium]|nr:ABC transporter permease subunit [Verrucomicrobiae bacterium]
MKRKTTPTMAGTSLFSPIWVIAKNTYRELIRERLLYGVFLIAALVTALSFFLSTVSLGQNARILHNIGLATIHLFTLFILIFVTTNSITKDLDKRTVYFLFPKPITRGQYVLGKYVGLIFLLLTTLVILGGLFLMGVFFTEKSLVLPAVTNLAFSFLEISLLIALAQLFASFTAPLNASLYSIALYIIGHSLTLLRDFLAEQGSALVSVINACYYILPNLEKFDIRAATLYGIPLGSSQVMWTIGYWAVYTGLALFLTTQVIRKREF